MPSSNAYSNRRKLKKTDKTKRFQSTKNNCHIPDLVQTFSKENYISKVKLIGFFISGNESRLIPIYSRCHNVVPICGFIVHLILLFIVHVQILLSETNMKIYNC